MGLDSGDLQQRRPASVAQAKSNRKTAKGFPVRRKKRLSPDDRNRAACLAAALFAAFFIPLGFMMNRLLAVDSNSVEATTAGGEGSGPSRILTSAAGTEAVVEAREARYQSLYRPKFDKSTLGYDIHNCPPTPPHDYPQAWPITDVLTNWNPNDVTTVSPSYREVYHGLCIFDYQTQYDIALTYRNAEKPFVIRNDPKVMATSNRWDGDPEYLHRHLGDVKEFRTERSTTNQFMWYRLRGKKKEPKGWKKPDNDEINMSFGEWLEHALEKEVLALNTPDAVARVKELKERRMAEGRAKDEDDTFGEDDRNERGNGGDSEEAKQKKWYYFRLNADLKHAKRASHDNFVYDELPFFDPRKREDSEFYIVDPEEERGINCRFGMRGVIAANHFDFSRNMIAIFGGERRYVLGHPSQCPKMALYPRGHPSLRHSSIDWSNPAEWDLHPGFKETLVNEVVMHAGDVLYLPTAWFHYIVNLGLNFQCNARSGITYENSHYIDSCGFDAK